MVKPALIITKDFTQKFNDAVKTFKRDSVLVGIPAADNSRDGEEPIGNAAILAINHFGSDNGHIPPRPVLSTGIRNAQDKIAEQFKVAAKSVLSKGTQALKTYYERAGIIASNSCKKVINDQEGIKAPADSTIEAREARGFLGKKALVVTGQMRNAITYVVK